MDMLHVVGLLGSPGGWGLGWGPGPWWPLVPLLWITLIGAVAWLVARGARPGERSGMERARDILAERFARGELTPDEYRQRLEQLR